MQGKFLQQYVDIAMKFADAGADICLSKPSSGDSLLPILKGQADGSVV
jgi:hypothetical protein